MNRKKIMFSFATAAMAAVGLFAELVPAPLFNHGMVLQRDKKVAVWGKADVGADVTVAFAGASVTGKAGENGAWRVDLPAMEACAIPREMRISSSEGDKIVYTNAVVGEVWLCGGQSNMTAAMWPKPQMFVYAARERNGYFDIMLTNEPDIRAVRVKEKWAAEETDREQFEWFSFTGGNGANFSAVAWHYAVRLHQALGIPVGVVQSAWGASNIETWIPAEGFAASKSFKSIAGMPVSTELNEDEKKRKAAAPDMQKRPRACWNAMIYPLVPYTFRGAIWYQGCSNRRTWQDYYELLGTLRDIWSKKFENPDMPFFFCQITPFSYCTPESKDNGEIQIREEMERFALDNAPNVGLAVLSDVGEIDNIHPGDKRTVGTRLAALSLNRIYGFKHLKCDAPVLDDVAVSDDAALMTLTFKNVEDWCMSGSYKLRFEIAGDDGEYVLAEARPIKRTNKIELKVPSGMTPRYVSYMRKSCVHGFLKNEAGIPVGPFRRELKK